MTMLLVAWVVVASLACLALFAVAARPVPSQSEQDAEFEPALQPVAETMAPQVCVAARD